MRLRIAFLTTLSFIYVNAFAGDNNTVLSLNNEAPLMQTDGKNKGEAFLGMNKTKPGVITLPDGLQYKVLEEGSGPKPKLTDTVTVDYVGTFIDGKEFDSSYKAGQPASFPVGAVIPGWVEALQLMKKGATWMLYIPAKLAYGAQGAPPTIGPNETLVFKVHLIDIK